LVSSGTLSAARTECLRAAGSACAFLRAGRLT
jgi:hypothetical protein